MVRRLWRSSRKGREQWWDSVIATSDAGFSLTEAHDYRAETPKSIVSDSDVVLQWRWLLFVWVVNPDVDGTTVMKASVSKTRAKTCPQRPCSCHFSLQVHDTRCRGSHARTGALLTSQNPENSKKNKILKQGAVGALRAAQ